MTEPTSAAAAVPDQNLLSRAIGIITSPGATFQTVVAYPRPAGILFVVCVVLALATGGPQFTARGRQAALDMQVQQTERLTGKPVTPEAYARMEQFGKYGGILAVVGIFVAVPLISLLFAAIYWAVFNAILGGTASFKQVLGIVTHSAVIGALGAVLAAPIQYIQGVQSTSGPFNLGAALPMLEPGSFLANYLGGINIFTVWSLIVTAIGLAVLYRRRSTGIAIGLVAAYLVLAAAMTATLGSFMGRS
jgi:hypothetical protein